MASPEVGGLVAVHAHPDDETLATGTLLATWATSGAPVTVVTCTRGELGEVIGPELAHLEGDGPALAAHREVELAAALGALGVGEHLFLDRVEPVGAREPRPAPVRFSDSGMAWAGTGRAGRLDDLPPGAFVAVALDDAAGRLARVLRTRRPQVVATYEPGGGYGHPDHVRAHEVTARAVELAADPAWHPDAGPAHRVAAVLWAAQGENALRAAYAALAPHQDAALTAPDPAGLLPSVAVPDATVDLVVDVLPVLDKVLGALRAHATQVQAVTAEPALLPEPGAADGPTDLHRVVARYALSNDVLAPVLAAEGYRLAPGSSTAGLSLPAGVRRVA
ncbi:PIG-L family deacetylase [Cellulomonas sp. P22]|uniref:PIG-L family deacetylase n=1 Tax=Cellulomonas sp. P22 TaxID=3373189 RepID=UPI0037995864